MYCRLESLKETDTGVQNHIKESLYGYSYSKVVKRLFDFKLSNWTSRKSTPIASALLCVFS